MEYDFFRSNEEYNHCSSVGGRRPGYTVVSTSYKWQTSDTWEETYRETCGKITIRVAIRSQLIK